MAAWNAAPASCSARSSLATRSCNSSRLPTTAANRLLKSFTGMFIGTMLLSPLSDFFGRRTIFTSPWSGTRSPH
jgi:hypothetical protein